MSRALGGLNSPIKRTSFTVQRREFAALVVAVGRDFTSSRFFIESVHVLLEDGPAKRNENKTFEPRNGSLLTFVDRMAETRIFGRAFKRNESRSDVSFESGSEEESSGRPGKKKMRACGGNAVSQKLDPRR